VKTVTLFLSKSFNLNTELTTIGKAVKTVHSYTIQAENTYSLAVVL